VKRLVAVLGLLIASAGVMLASAGPASALPDLLGCTTAPTPEVPGRGITSFFESPPDVPPAQADPFADDAKVTIYQEYGYAGLRWNTYDLGCGPDLARAPDAAIGTAVANWMIALSKVGIAATGAILGAAFEPDFLGFFDPLVTQVVDVLQRTVFEQWAYLVLAALGGLVIWRARQLAQASTVGMIGWAVLVMVLVTMVFRWPLVAGHAADESLTTTLGAVTAGLNGKDPADQSGAAVEATSRMQESLLYQAWLGGTFGRSDSPVAKKYGPVIFDATALTWSEAATLEKDPAAGKKIIEAKQQKFEDAAAKIKDEDPDAYAYLQGKRSDTRVGYALLAGLGTLCAIPLLLMAGLLVIGALVIVRFGVMLFPAFATLGLFPTMRTLVTGIGSTVIAALINAFFFGLGASVTVLGMGFILDPTSTIPPWLQVVLMLLLTVIMWVALRPFRRLTQMVGQRNHFQEAAAAPADAARTTGRFIRRGVVTGAGAAISGGVGGAVVGEVITGSTEPPQRAEAQPDAQPIFIHPPTPAIEAKPGPTVIVQSSDLPQPAITSTLAAHAAPEVVAPPPPDDAGPPVRAEAQESTYPDVDWSTYEREMTERAEP
jgi:uncharacterized membrane protein